MKSLFRLGGLFLLLAWLPAARGQFTPPPKVASIEIRHVGPPAAGDKMILANIRVKEGDPYRPGATDDDVRNLYATGLFYNIRVTGDIVTNGVALTYIVQGKPRLADIKFRGNAKYSDSKLRKKLTSKTGDPLDEQKLFTDCQEIQKKYQSAGRSGTTVKYV
jgi:outer membrane protein insertion porin family